jgi:hypothetical protein
MLAHTTASVDIARAAVKAVRRIREARHPRSNARCGRCDGGTDADAGSRADVSAHAEGSPGLARSGGDTVDWAVRRP